MQLALDAARKARARTAMTAWVGAVVVKDGTFVSVGATQPDGGAHAEAIALAAAGDVAGAHLYTTLEPCVPFEGKRNRPCADAIIAAGVGRVVIALQDPDANVSGRGIELLRSAGLKVELGDGAEQALELLRPYIKHRVTGLPYVIAKFAASLDGRSASASGDSKWITGEAARDLAHRQRAWVDGVMVGSSTVLVDDPALTARPGGALAEKQPVRIVLDSRGRVSPGAQVFAQPGRVIVATAYEAAAEWKRAIAGAGAQVLECEGDEHGLNLDQLLATLGQRGMISIWAEGGATLLGSLLDGGHADEVWAFIAPVILGQDALPAVAGLTAPTMAEALRLSKPVAELVPPDVLIRGYTGSWAGR